MQSEGGFARLELAPHRRVQLQWAKRNRGIIQREILLSMGMYPTLHRLHNFGLLRGVGLHNLRCIDALGYRIDNAAINLIKEESHV